MLAAALLREPQRIDAILGALRDAVNIKFTVKTRVGFSEAHEFDTLLPFFAKHSLDALTVHARTVVQMYRPAGALRFDPPGFRDAVLPRHRQRPFILPRKRRNSSPEPRRAAS